MKYMNRLFFCQECSKMMVYTYEKQLICPNCNQRYIKHGDNFWRERKFKKMFKENEDG